MDDNLYHYRAVISSVWDGDTCTADIDLGFSFSYSKIKLRLYGIDAPELRGETLEAARASRDFLREKVLNKEVLLQTIKDSTGKYGRYLANIWLKQEDGSYILVNDLLVIEGHAIHREY